MKNTLPAEKKVRVIINTDAKNEADDQFAIVQAALTPSFELHGFIAAHFGELKSRNSMQDSFDEIMLLLKIMNLKQKFRVEAGASRAMIDEKTPQESPGAKLIINEAFSDDPRPLHIAFLGTLTDMASALLMEPRIAQKNIRVVWIGGGQWPTGGREYNLGNDIHAANVVFQSGLEIWQIPRDVYRMMPVSHAELIERVYPFGQLGQYLTRQLIEFNNMEKIRPAEYRVLGDSPAIGVMIYPDCGKWSLQSAPRFDKEMNYIHTNNSTAKVRVYETIDPRFIMEDFYAKLSQFNRGHYESDIIIKNTPIKL
jgi:inosine-uridine nucleoside N-ribohydrolase